MKNFKSFIKSNEVLTVEFVQALIEEAVSTVDWIDCLAVVEDIEASFIVALVEERLCGMFESVGTIDYMILLHQIKHVYYSHVSLDEFERYRVSEAGHMIMKDQLLRLDRLLRQNEAGLPE